MSPFREKDQLQTEIDSLMNMEKVKLDGNVTWANSFINVNSSEKTNVAVRWQQSSYLPSVLAVIFVD
tara:strand:- start:372 stop:572 length:201 start_codon:yes stop_codon:yes gene_type:complete